MRDVLIEGIHRRMRSDERVVFVTADFGSPKLDTLISEFPERFINVGIAEQNLINVAAGLALEGFKVCAYGIAAFITMRCYEQIRVNLAILSELRELNVTLIGVGAGFSYDCSGPSHQVFEDISIMRALANVEVLSPADWVTAQALGSWSLDTPTPTYLRLDGRPCPALYSSASVIPLQQGFAELRQGYDVCVVSTGYMTGVALGLVDHMAAEGRRVGVVDMFRLSTFDAAELARILERYGAVVTVEEGFAHRGGLDSLVLHVVNSFGLGKRVTPVGLDASYRFDLGTRATHHVRRHIGDAAISAAIRESCLAPGRRSPQRLGMNDER